MVGTFRGRVTLGVITVVGTVVTVVATMLAQNLEDRRLQDQFTLLANQRMTALGLQVRASLDVVEAARAFCEASTVVTDVSFDQYAGALIEQHHSIHALRWVPGSYPASDPSHEQALMEASASGELVVSGPSNVVRSSAEEGDPAAAADILVVAAVFDRAPGGQRPSLTSDGLRGFVVAECNAGELLRKSFAGVFFHGLELHVHDVTGDQPRWLAAYGTQAPFSGSLGITDGGGRHAYRIDPFTIGMTIDVGGRDWRVTTTAGPSYFEARSSSVPWSVACGCGGTTVLLALFLTSVMGRTEHVERLVKERTAQLQMQTELLTHEIEERERSEMELSRANHQVARSNASLAERNAEILHLAYAISHDLQSPLATLTGAVNALSFRLQEIDPETESWMQRIERASERMVSMLNRMLVYTKAGAADMPSEQVDVARQVEAVVGEMAGQIEQAGASVEVCAQAGVAMADTQMVDRIIENLIGNALKFAADDRPLRIHVSVGRDADVVRLKVEDNGCGISPEDLDAVFQPFQRRTTMRQGSGLGLAIIRRYVTGIGGRTWLESDGSSGTTAVVELPRADAAGPALNSTLQEQAA